MSCALPFYLCATLVCAGDSIPRVYGGCPAFSNEERHNTARVQASPPPLTAPWGDHQRGVPLPLPPLDARAQEMLRADLARIEEATFTQAGYFLAAVPRILQCIAGPGTHGDGHDDAQANWQAYANAYSYKLHTWRPDDVLSGRLPADEAVRCALTASIDAQRLDVAAHLTGLAVLAHEGGIWLGPRTRPPRVDGEDFDLDEVVHMQGLTVATNRRARHVGGISAYLTTHLMAAPANHPWLQEVVVAAARNTTHLLGQGIKDWPARYYAGNSYLSQQLAGVMHILPFTTLQKVGVFPVTYDDGDEDALD